MTIGFQLSRNAVLVLHDDHAAIYSPAMQRLRHMAIWAFIMLMGAGITQSGIAPASAETNESSTSLTTDTIEHAIFEEYFGRRATAAELKRLPPGLTENQARATVLASPEFYEHVGNTDRDFIVSAYQAVLGRAPLQAEFTRANQRFPQGAAGDLRNRQQFAMDLLAGTKYRHLGTSAFPFWPDRVFEDQRIIAYYGHHFDSRLGVLGETGAGEAVQRVNAAAAPFDQPGTPAVGAFEMIVTVAQASPGADGDFSNPSELTDVEEWVDIAEQHGLYVILDIQPGRSDFLTESRRYEALLLRPHVGLALDPEWRMGPTQVPGEVVGRVTADEVNQVSEWLAQLVSNNDLPEKIFIIHQFQERMVVNRDQVIDRPGLATMIHADGFGNRDGKQATYSRLHVDAPLYNGFKLFIDEDTNIYQPDEVLAFTENPVPDFVSYQ